MALTESSDELVAACSDGKLRTYELQFGAKMGEFSGMGLPLIDVQACSHSRFATVSEQCPVVEIWCIEEGRVVMTLTGAQDPVTRLLVHPRVSLFLQKANYLACRIVHLGGRLHLETGKICVFLSLPSFCLVSIQCFKFVLFDLSINTQQA